MSMTANKLADVAARADELILGKPRISDEKKDATVRALSGVNDLSNRVDFPEVVETFNIPGIGAGDDLSAEDEAPIKEMEKEIDRALSIIDKYPDVYLPEGVDDMLSEIDTCCQGWMDDIVDCIAKLTALERKLAISIGSMKAAKDYIAKNTEPEESTTPVEANTKKKPGRPPKAGKKVDDKAEDIETGVEGVSADPG
ncbi:MAG: hypothetical protein GY938_24550 [Ketobacter sp.]|nr:hypothetical protein [Ketobacter sp.]